MASTTQNILGTIQKAFDKDASARSGSWLLGKFKNPPAEFSLTERRKNRAGIGSMYLFVYDAKGKATLPFFDRCPLVFPIEIYSDGFLGLNLHYLPVNLRAEVLNRLIKISGDKTITDTTRLRLSYDTIKGVSRLKVAEPCIKRYLYTHVRSKFIFIHPSEWGMAINLPVENWYRNNRKKKP